MLQSFDGRQTNWEGLWWHPEYCGYSSKAFNLSELKKFKGTVRIYARKNKFYNNGENGRPNMSFCLKDSKSDAFTELSIKPEDEYAKMGEDGHFYTKDGNRLYSHEEVQYAINRAAEDGARGYGWGDNTVSDYLD